MVQTQTFIFPKPNIEQVFTYGLAGHPKDSRCNLRFYSGKKNQLVILTELRDNPGASITNAAEYLPKPLKNWLRQNYNIELAEDAIFVEHYEANHYGDGEEERFALLDSSGRFQHLSDERLKLIFQENFGTNWDVIALLDSWASEEADGEEQRETWEFIERNWRHSPFVVPQLEFWTIYQNLPSYPHKFVALKFITSTRTEELIIEDSLEALRDVMERENRKRIEPQPEEELNVVEIWV